MLMVLIEDKNLMQGATKWKHNMFELSCLASYFLFCNGNVANRHTAMLMLSGILCSQKITGFNTDAKTAFNLVLIVSEPCYDAFIHSL